MPFEKFPTFSKGSRGVLQRIAWDAKYCNKGGRKVQTTKLVDVFDTKEGMH